MTIRRWLENNVYMIEVDDMLDVDTTNEPRGNSRNAMHSQTFMSDHSRATWRAGGVGNGSLAEAKAVLHDGWPEGLEMVARLSEQLQTELPAPKSFKRRGQWREDGDEPSWERAQYGRTEVWRTSQRDTAVGPVVVRLMCPWSHSAYRTAKEITWNGIVLAVLCDLLERSGYRVGATLCNTVRLGFNDYIFGMLNVKQPSQPLDLATLVPMVAHPAPYRWFGINWATLGPVDCGSGKGSPVPYAEIPNVPSKPHDAIVLRTVYCEADARAEILRVLATFATGNPASKHSEVEEGFGF